MDKPQYKLVPVDPSIAMCIRGATVADNQINGHVAAQVYAAMLHAAPSPAISGMEGVDDKIRLLTALERAATAESALRALVDECDNDCTAGWEDRMQARINDANRILAAPSLGIDAHRSRPKMSDEPRKRRRHIGNGDINIGADK